jgi:hypothetical protein
LISERQLAELFDSFWQQHFPLLNASFIRRFNAEQQERVTTLEGAAVLPVPMGKGIKRFDLVAELAFEMAMENHSAKAGAVLDYVAATRRALGKIALLNREPFIPPPEERELRETKRLLNVYRSFLAQLPSADIQLKPRIRGTGILDAMEADFCTPKTLFEVKTVHRNLQSSDLRQVICYLVAGLGSRQFTWTEYCIFNPRLAVFYHGRIDELLAYISGRTPHECINSFQDALMDREQPVESRF